MKLRTTLALAAAAIPLAAVQAQTLKIGLSAEPTSADPHYHKMTQNDAFSAHVYSSLVGRSADMKLVPALATSWKNLDDLTWEFKLRDDVKFSNGKPFTSEDVLFTICRTLNNETNVSQSYMDTTKLITDVQTPDAHTVIIKTGAPFPLMPAEMARSLPIIWNGIVEHGKLTFDPKKGCGVTGAWPTVADFNNGKDAIGTGPYTLKSYVKGTGIELVRNENYWGPKPYWKEVKFVPVPAAGPRLTGLLSGDFDMIENPAARDLQRLKDNPKFGFVATPSTRLIFFQPDVGRAQSPFVKAADGKNPLQDLRVRKAISMAIDRKTITARIMDGMATPAYQFMPDGMFGAPPKAEEIKYDPEGAKKLLAEAGYPNGFELTISSTNDRYVNDGQVAQAVAQYLSRIGIKTTVDAMTASIYFPARQARIQLPDGRLAGGNGRGFGAVPAVGGLAGFAQQPGHQQLRRLLQRRFRQGLQAGHRDGGRTQARSAAAAVHQDRAGQRAADPAALRKQHLGIPQGHQLRRPPRPVHAGHLGQA